MNRRLLRWSLLIFLFSAAATYTWIDRSPSTSFQVERKESHTKRLTQETHAEVTTAHALISNHAPDGHCAECNAREAILSASVDADHPRPFLKITPSLRQSLLSKTENSPITFPLPGAEQASGIVEMTRQENGQTVAIQGSLIEPQTGIFFFQLQTMPGVAGEMVGAVLFNDHDIAYSVLPGADGQPELHQKQADSVVCRNYSRRPEEIEVPEEIPSDYPSNPPIPEYQNGIVPLNSLPKATAVAYLDFDGAEGPYELWGGNYTAAPANTDNTNVREIWERVSEDFAPYNINITTDLQVYLDAPENSRIRCIITPTDTAEPGAGGVAFVGSFNYTGDIPCWVFIVRGKSCAEAVSHEIGHTLGLRHDGRTSPSEEYYSGHGSGDVSWAPIMGLGYFDTLTQWSQGEYLNANNSEDDLAEIDTNNNVDYRADDYGATLATAGLLEILNDDSVDSEGLIEKRTDEDALKFTLTATATVSLSVSAVSKGPNLDILAEIVDETGTVVTSDNPDTAIDATVSATLVTGDYFLRISGVGRGNPSGEGYTDYASLGFYTVTGTVPNAIKPDRFNLPENSTIGSSIGTISTNNDHGAAALSYAIASGNDSGTFAINPSTGELTVADPAILDYEVLARDYNLLAGFELFVDIINASNTALNERVRVIITISDVNEAPTLTTPTNVSYLLSPTTNGTNLLTVQGADPDIGQALTYTIIAGNDQGEFTIAPSTGDITVANSAAINQSNQPYSLSIQVSDNQNPALTATAVLTIELYSAPDGYTPGTLIQKFYENITGNTLISLTNAAVFPASPNSLSTLTRFASNEHGDNYGSTISGVIFVPETGNYTFWLASDDEGELRLSTDDSLANATIIASVSGWTNEQEWDKYSSQESAPITLRAGQAYYIEARYKEGGGGDHCAVAWQGPGFSRQIIGSQNIAPKTIGSYPVIDDQIVALDEDAPIGTLAGAVIVTDADSSDTHLFSITLGNTDDAFAIDTSGNITTAAALNHEALASYNLTVTVIDSNGLSDTATVTINVNDLDENTVTGLVAWEDAVYNTNLPVQLRRQALAGNETSLIDMSDMEAGDASYEFIVDAVDFSQVASTLLRDSTWALNLEAWNDTNRLGMVRYGVADYTADAILEQSVASPYGKTVHIVFAVDAGAGTTRIYLDGVHVGSVPQLPVIDSANATLGDSDLRNDASTGIYAFVTYNTTLPHQEIITHYRAWFGADSPVDADSDTLDDSWELSNFGNLGVVSANDATTANGITAFEAMVFGVDPNASTSSPEPQQGRVINDAGVDKFEFKFRRPQNHLNLNVSYQLESRSNLTAGAWGEISTPPTIILKDGTNEWVVYELPLADESSAQNFYRCKVMTK